MQFLLAAARHTGCSSCWLLQGVSHVVPLGCCKAYQMQFFFGCCKAYQMCSLLHGPPNTMLEACCTMNVHTFTQGKLVKGCMSLQTVQPGRWIWSCNIQKQWADTKMNFKHNPYGPDKEKLMHKAGTCVMLYCSPVLTDGMGRCFSAFPSSSLLEHQCPGGGRGREDHEYFPDEMSAFTSKVLKRVLYK